MAKKSNTLKEISQIVVFVLVVGILLTVFVIYPLSVSKHLLGRADIDTYTPDSTQANDASAFVDAGLLVDTFTVEPETYIRLEAVRLEPVDSTGTPLDLQSAWPGTVILLPDERKDRTSVIPLAKELVDTGYSVITYDQRASGLSTGLYHSDGQYEASDLAEVVSYLRFRELLTHPFITIGQAAGADAALLDSREDSRVDGVIAIDPYLSTERWLDTLKSEYHTWWFPFSNTILWFWYGLRSDYAAPYREVKDIKPVKVPTLVIASEPLEQSAELAKLKEVSDSTRLTVVPLPKTQDELDKLIVDWVIKRSAINPQ